MAVRKFPILYKFTTKGKVQQWQIFVDDDKFYTQEGLKGGTLTTSLPTVCKPKNVGKKNETSAKQQAEAEAKAKFQKKLDKGYNEKEAKKQTRYHEPMLAFEADLDVLDFKVPTYVQPKLDGLRADNNNNKLTSRNGKPYLGAPHLYQDLARLDGELYTHIYKDDFNEISSICKQQTPTEEELKKSEEKMEFWAYDFPEHNGVFSERHKALREFFMKHKLPGYVLTPTYRVYSLEEIKERHKEFRKQGYEGTIIRLDIGPYENKRSKQLLKLKDWVDAEFTITGATEGKGGRTGTIGKFTLSFPESKGAKTFDSNVKGSHEYLKQVWKDRNKYIGKKATVEYHGLTPVKEKKGVKKGGVPKWPYIIKLDREAYE